jgi:hypothetical protein
LVPITNTVRRSEAAAICSACNMAYGVSTIAQSFVRSGASCAAIASTSRSTASAELTLGTTIASGPAAQAARRSSTCQSVSAPLTRTASSRLPYSPDVTAAQAESRAATLASGATASSRSRIRPSQGIDFAFSSARSLDEGM